MHLQGGINAQLIRCVQVVQKDASYCMPAYSRFSFALYQLCLYNVAASEGNSGLSGNLRSNCRATYT